MTLGAKNKLCFIDGSLPKPTTLADLVKAWARCNHMIFSWLIFKRGFFQGNGPRVFEIRCAIANTRQEQLSVAAYFSKLKRNLGRIELLFKRISLYLWFCEGDTQRNHCQAWQRCVFSYSTGKEAPRTPGISRHGKCRACCQRWWFESIRRHKVKHGQG